MTKVLFKNGNVFYHGKIQKLDVLIENDKIIDIKQNIDQADEIINIADKLLTPGFVDIHVHLREPGFEHKETIATGTMSRRSEILKDGLKKMRKYILIHIAQLLKS